MWSLVLFAHLASGGADARALRTVTIRPLPPVVRTEVEGAPTKEQLIAASFVEYTVTHTRLGRFDAKNGGLLSFPAVFTCVVTDRVLTVSYTREEIDAAALPAIGSCGTGDDAVRFRIKVVPATVGA